MPLSLYSLGVLHLDALHLTPIEVDDAGSRKTLERFDPFPPHMAVNGSPDGFGPAGALLGAHQFVHEFFINRNGCTHNKYQYR
jgi:hypothetical protein